MKSANSAIAVLLAAALAASAASPDLLSPRLGDASVAADAAEASNICAIAQIAVPDGTHDVCITYWMRTADGDVFGVAPNVMWCPRLVRSGPDILGGAGGWGEPSGVGIPAGGISVPWACTNSAAYANGLDETPAAAAQNAWGAYTLAGWAGSDVTVTLGSVDVTFPGGGVETNFNAVGGPGAAVSITGSGRCCIGISQMVWNEFFGDFAYSLRGEGDISALVRTDWAFAAFRIHLDAATHYCDVVIWKPDDYTERHFDLAMPRGGATELGSATFLRVCGSCPGVETLTHIDVWDMRVKFEAVADEEVVWIHDDGAAELLRRP